MNRDYGSCVMENQSYLYCAFFGGQSSAVLHGKTTTAKGVGDVNFCLYCTIDISHNNPIPIGKMDWLA